MYFENSKNINIDGETQFVPKHLINESIVDIILPLIKKAMRLVYLTTGEKYVPQDYEKIYIRRKDKTKTQYRIDLFVHEISKLYQRRIIIDGIIFYSKIHVNFVRNLESVDKAPRSCPSIAYESDNCKQSFWVKQPKLAKEKFGISTEGVKYAKTDAQVAPKRDKWNTLHYEFA